MLLIEIPLEPEYWDEEKSEFVIPPGYPIELEHSLVSLSKWESKYCKPFFSKNDKTSAEILDYIKMMAVTPVERPEIWDSLTQKNVDDIRAYIDAPMTATTFSKESKATHSREVITSELIYYWMIALTIPFECQYWHINRLLTLIRVCNIKNAPPKKQSKSDIMRRNAALNAERRARLNTKG